MYILPSKSFNKAMKSKYLNYILMQAESSTKKAFSSHLRKKWPNIEVGCSSNIAASRRLKTQLITSLCNVTMW